jgi:hypothetical protein
LRGRLISESGLKIIPRYTAARYEDLSSVNENHSGAQGSLVATTTQSPPALVGTGARPIEMVGCVLHLQKSVWGSPNWGSIPGPYAY